MEIYLLHKSLYARYSFLFIFMTMLHVQIDDSMNVSLWTCLYKLITTQLFEMPVGIEAWITQIPPITRGWLALSILISLAVVGLFGFLAF